MTTPSEAVRVAVQECKRFAKAAMMGALNRPADRVSDPHDLLIQCFERIDALAALSLHVGDAADSSDALGASALPTALYAPALRASAPIAGAGGESDRWIPVSERLPQAGEMVLTVLVTGHVWTGFNSGNGAWETLHETEDEDGMQPTHWMPLPAPPGAQAIVTREGQDPQGLGGEAIERGPAGMRPEEIAQPFLHIEPAPGHRWIQATMEEWDEVQRIRDAATTPTEGPAQTLTPEALYEIVPPSAAEYMSQPPVVELSSEWQMGWDACRNATRLELDEVIAKVRASTLTDPEGAS